MVGRKITMAEVKHSQERESQKKYLHVIKLVGGGGKMEGNFFFKNKLFFNTRVGQRRNPRVDHRKITLGPY